MNYVSTVRTYRLDVHGYESGGAETIERASPASGRLVSRFARGTAADCEAAIRVARNAFDQGPWPRMSGAERAAVIRRWANLVEEDKERLARIEVDEVGKPIRTARGDLDGVVDLFQFAAGLAMQVHGETFTNLGPDKTAWVHREPIGVVGMIIPWNFPAIIFAQKVPYALAAGCTVVVKPSEFTSGTALELARLGRQAGIPEGVLSVVTGYGDPVGEILVKSPEVDFVSFTGSTAVGRRIVTNSAETLKRVSVELGGKSANIVFADADLDDAIDGSLFGIFFNQGECCCSAARLLVDETIADMFVERLAARAKAMKVGDVHADDSEVGAMISENHFNKVCSYFDKGKAEGAKLLAGGEADRSGGGLFVQPTVFDYVLPSMTIFREEIFGPILSISRFKTLEEAVALANDTNYGLANTIWTKNFDTAHMVAPRLRSGTVWINTTIDNGPQTPFGGYKASGFGREMGQHGFDEFTNVKAVVARLGKRTPYYATR
ncbi:aldehyde dehydrogenase family protein [Bradyrhizobium sp. LMTR 3]|uniref:aldehyde dehydrogenase family protein n=1 Tax=Bradyrhizobium sp. LMTR 3 TaxID=189873 RepID=UPI0008109A24|nr:aldehyde dehydrogenase family protein [Bradyrhizobium sp. LMTR 3]OCK59894.1 sorbosone dehydrogenase [Bradyrhizobium sp. LMTR 3]